MNFINISGRAYFHSFIVSVPHSWSQAGCNVSSHHDNVHVPKQSDIIVTGSGVAGHVKKSVGGDSVVMPATVVTSQNVSAMMDLWTLYR